MTTRQAFLIPCILATHLLTVGCGRDGGRDRDAGAFAQQVAVSDTLPSRTLFDGEALGRPQSIALVGEWILVGDVPRPQALHIIRHADGRLLASWGREGRGPGEFRDLWSIQPADDRSAWLYDPAQTRLTLLDVRALLTGAGDPVRRMVNLRADLIPMTAQWMADTLLVSSGMFTAGRLALFDGEGKLTRITGPLPSARKGVPPRVAQHAYTGTLVRHPSRPLVAIGTRHADRLEIHPLDGGEARVGRGPRGFEPAYEVAVRGGTPAMASGGDLRFGYVELAAAGGHLYALYSGWSREERPGRANYGGEVHVFDWSGRLLRILPLDHLALALAVSPDEHTLYTLRHDPIPAVLRTTLSGR